MLQESPRRRAGSTARVLAKAMARLYKGTAFTVTEEEFAELRSVVGELARRRHQ